MRGLLTLLVATVLMFTVIGVGACGGGGGTESGKNQAARVDEAKSMVRQLEKPVSFTAPGSPVDVGDQLEGKTVYFVASQTSFPFVQNIVDGVKESAKVLGMNVVVVNSNAEVARAASFIERGIGQGADVIVTQGFEAEELSAALGEAKDAGIPVIEVGGRDAGPLTQPLRDIGVAATVSYCYSCAGKQMVAAAVAKSGGDVNAVVVGSADFRVSDDMVTGIKSAFENLCPGCAVTYKETTAAQWEAQLPSLASSSIQSDPNVNYLLPVFDAMGLIMTPGVSRAGAQDKVKLVSWNATLGALQDMERGQFFEADVGASQVWLGWATMDQVARVLTGSKPVDSENIPNRLFTPANVDEIDLGEPESTWYGPVAFRAEYTRLWGK